MLDMNKQISSGTNHKMIFLRLTLRTFAMLELIKDKLYKLRKSFDYRLNIYIFISLRRDMQCCELLLAAT